MYLQLSATTLSLYIHNDNNNYLFIFSSRLLLTANSEEGQNSTLQFIAWFQA